MRLFRMNCLTSIKCCDTEIAWVNGGQSNPRKVMVTVVQYCLKNITVTLRLTLQQQPGKNQQMNCY